MAETWDETKPAGSRNPLLGDDDIREFKRAMRERLAMDHDFEASESPAFGDSGSTIGYHKQATLVEQASDPTVGANAGALYTKEASSVTELFMRGESSGTVKQLTRGGMQKINTLAFNDGTRDIAFPTNGMAAAKFMLGNADTIAWFYLNTAPPGWKVQAMPVQGKALAVAGSSDATWTIGGDAAGTWTQPDHVHGVGLVTDECDTSTTVTSGGSAAGGPDHKHTVGGNTANGATANTWRPNAYVGRLFKLDEA